jgi:transcription initiation factor TFIIB
MSDALGVKDKNQVDYAKSFFNGAYCSECGSTDIVCDETRGETICNNCGLVIKEHMVDTGPEWRSYTAEERKKRSRVGSPITYAIHDKGLSTMICGRNRDAYGRKFSPMRRLKAHRLRKWQERTRIRNLRERNLAHALCELNRLTSQLGIQNL